MSRKATWAPAITAMAPVLALVVLSACGFTAENSNFGVCTGFDQTGLTEVAGGPPALVLEDPGTIKVMHGSGRATYHSGTPVKVEQSADLPAYANQATVFLNGWNLGYGGGDQHMKHLGTVLARIRVERGKITWNAMGLLRDDGEEEAFTWSYHYTIVAWNDNSLRAMIDHNDCNATAPDAADNFFMTTNVNMTTALSCVPSVLQNPGFATGRRVAVVPRGFGAGWFGDDHHVLQLAYNLESTESFARHQPYYKGYGTVNPMPNPSTARAGGEYVSWNSCAVTKDDSRRRDYGVTELVSGMGGADVDVVEPAFSILPLDPADGGLGGAGLKSADVVIENLPYAYAVPMLTGWDIGYALSDQHVKEIGIWIDNLRYDRPPGASTGTLRYKVHSIVKDDDTFPDNYYSHKVTVLGLKTLTGAPDFR